MMPLMISSVNCIYAVFSGGIYTTGGMFGVCASIFILIYYIAFGFEIMSNSKKSGYYCSSYKFMNFDQPHWWVKEHIKSYEFFVYWVLVIVMVITCNAPKYPLAIAALLFAVNLICTVITPTKPYKREKHQTIRGLKILKSVESFFKIVWFVIVTVFVMRRDSIGSMGIKLFTVLSMVILYVIIAFNWGIFLMRVVGLCGRGHESSMTIEGDARGGDGDAASYSELEDQKQPPTTSMHAQKKSS